MIVLALIGLGVASYLTYVHYAGIKPACTAGESCRKCRPPSTPSSPACPSH